MKHRKLLYVLLPAVLIIWGMIVFRVISWLREDSQIDSTVLNPSNKMSPDFVTDTFTLMLNYPNPFGLHTVGRKTSGFSGGKVSKMNNWPSISFYGTISIGKRKNPIACLCINGSDMIMKSGETYNGLKILSVRNNSIVVSYLGEIQEITGNKNNNNR